MILNKFSIKDASTFIVFLYFPFFLTYQILLAYGSIPPFLGGGITAITIVSFIILIIFTQPIFKNKKNNYSYLAFIYFLYIISFVLTGSVFTKESNLITNETLSQSLLNTLYAFVFFIVGYYANFNSKNLLKVFFLIVYILTIMAIYYIYMEKKQYLFFSNLSPVIQSGLVTYQGHARTFFVIWLVLLSFMNPKINQKLIIGAMGLFVLYSLGSRSELIAGLLVFITLVLLVNMKSKKNILYILTLFSIIIFIIMNSVNLDLVFEGHRIFELQDLTSSSSWQAREALNNIAIEQIKNNPILGEFGGHIINGGNSGSYAHNALSAWVSYGFFGFIVYILLTTVALLGSLIIFLTRIQKNTYYYNLTLLSLSLSATCFLLILTTKSVFWLMPPLCWGIYAQLLSISKRRNPKCQINH